MNKMYILGFAVLALVLTSCSASIGEPSRASYTTTTTTPVVTKTTTTKTTTY